MKYISCFILLALLCGCHGTAGRTSSFLPFEQEKALVAEKVSFGEVMASQSSPSASVLPAN